MTTEVKRLIQVRSDKSARFKRDGYGKKRQLSDSWRKPRGQHNKQREQKKARGALPKPGFGSPVAVRGMHPSGFFEVLVTSVKDLEGLDPKVQAVRLGATVGTRKRAVIQEAALSAGLKILNVRTLKAKARKAPAKPVIPEESGEKAEKKAGKKVPAGKAAAKPKEERAEKKAEKKTDKKVPAGKAAAKPKEEKAEKKAGKKVPAGKAAAKPKEEKAEKKAEKKTDKKVPAKKAATEPKTAAKSRAKTPKAGVKKNE